MVPTVCRLEISCGSICWPEATAREEILLVPEFLGALPKSSLDNVAVESSELAPPPRATGTVSYLLAVTSV